MVRVTRQFNSARRLLKGEGNVGITAFPFLFPTIFHYTHKVRLVAKRQCYNISIEKIMPVYKRFQLVT